MEKMARGAIKSLPHGENLFAFSDTVIAYYHFSRTHSVQPPPFCKGGCSCHIKDKLKSEILMTKKVYKQKYFSIS